MALALIALPKFYTQVLHLMNKMNLPPPFEERAIPGIFSKDREEKAAAADAQRHSLYLKRKFPGAQRGAANDFTVEEDEEDDEEEDGDKGSLVQSEQTEGIHDTKRQRIHDTDMVHTADASDTILPAVHDQQPASAMSVQKPSATTTVVSVHTSRAKRSGPTTGIAKAFENIGKSSEANRSVRPGVISEAVLNRQRLPLEGKWDWQESNSFAAILIVHERVTDLIERFCGDVTTDLKQYPAMAMYDRGAAPSRTLLVQNVAASVDEQDLAFVFGYVLPLHMELSYVAGLCDWKNMSLILKTDLCDFVGHGG